MDQLRLVGFDLDGTVIHPITRRISARVNAALQAAHDAGAACCIVTGRPYTMIEPEVAQAPWCDWVISSNGALVRNAGLTEVLQRLEISHELATKVIDTLADLDPALYITFDDAAYKEERVIPILRSRDDLALDWDKDALETSLAAFLTIPSVRDELERRGTGPLKFNILFPAPGIVEEAMARMEALGGLEACRMVDNSELELVATGVDKGDALDVIRERLGVPGEACVAFGDGGNDLPLAGHEFRFVAMGNAEEYVQQAADEVCAHVDDDGVALWLEDKLGL